MSADKMQEATDRMLRWRMPLSGVARQGFAADLDALIAAVREDERDKSVARVLVPLNRYTFAGNRMIGDDEGEYLSTSQVVEAIRNA